MATHDYVLANASGSSFRSDLNNALAAIVSQNSSATEPGTTFSYQYWIDTSVTPALVKQRNAANDAWVTLGEVDGQILANDGSVTKPGIAFASDVNTGIRRHAADKIGIVTNGANALSIDASQNVIIGDTTTPSCRLDIKSGQLGAPDGTVSAPSISFRSDLNTGIFRASADQMNLVSGGSARIRISDTVTRFHTTADAAPSASAAGMQISSSSKLTQRSNQSSTGNTAAIFGGTLGFAAVKANGNLENTLNQYGGPSDSKLKENIVDAASQWDDIKAVQVRKYNFKADTGLPTHTQIGVVAQELETVCPGLVSNNPDEDADGNELETTTKAVSYSVLHMKAVKALQEAMARIETLETKVAALEAAN